MSDPDAVVPRKPRMDDRPLHDVTLAIWGCPAVLVAHDLKLFPLLAEQPRTLPGHHRGVSCVHPHSHGA